MNNLSRTLLLCTIFLMVTTIGNTQEKGGEDLGAVGGEEVDQDVGGPG